MRNPNRRAEVRQLPRDRTEHPEIHARSRWDCLGGRGRGGERKHRMGKLELNKVVEISRIQAGASGSGEILLVLTMKFVVRVRKIKYAWSSEAPVPTLLTQG